MPSVLISHHIVCVTWSPTVEVTYEIPSLIRWLLRLLRLSSLTTYCLRNRLARSHDVNLRICKVEPDVVVSGSKSHVARTTTCDHVIAVINLNSASCRETIVSSVVPLTVCADLETTCRHCEVVCHEETLSRSLVHWEVWCSPSVHSTYNTPL